MFKNATPQQLFELYMDSKKHAASTGVPAKISSIEGGKFSAHDGYIQGRNLQLIKNKLIVQSWRSSDWSKDDVDSTFIIHFVPKGKDATLHIVHANVPDKEAAGIDSGWHDYYWEPWKKYLAGNPVSKAMTM